MTARLPSVALAAIALSACGDDGGGAQNPPRLWLALAGSEVEVQLIPVEPEPY